MRKDRAAVSLAFIFGLLLFISSPALAQGAQTSSPSEEKVVCDQYICGDLEEEQDPTLDSPADPPQDVGEMPVDSASPDATQRENPEESTVDYVPGKDVTPAVAADVAPKERKAVVDEAAAPQLTETATCEQYGCGNDGGEGKGDESGGEVMCEESRCDDGGTDNETGLSCGANDKFVGTEIYCRPHHFPGDANGGPIDFTPCGEDDCGMKGVPSYMVCHRRSSTTTESGDKSTFYPGFVECENVNEYGNEAPHELCFLSFYLNGREALRVWCDDDRAGGPDGAKKGLDDARKAVDAVKRSRKNDDTGGVDLTNLLTPGDDSADSADRYAFSVEAFFAALGLAPGVDQTRSAGGETTDGTDLARGDMVAGTTGSGDKDPEELGDSEERGATERTSTTAHGGSGAADTDQEQSAAPGDQAAEELVEAAESAGVGSVTSAAPLVAADIAGSGGDEAADKAAVNRSRTGEPHIAQDGAALVPQMVAEVSDVALRTIRGQNGGLLLALSGFLLLLAGYAVSRGILRH